MNDQRTSCGLRNAEPEGGTLAADSTQPEHELHQNRASAPTGSGRGA